MPHYEDTDITNLENRVDSLENRVTALETKITTGFQDIKNLMNNLFQEKCEWGKFARESLRAIGKWLAKYGAIVLLCAIGLSQGINIYKMVNADHNVRQVQ